MGGSVLGANNPPERLPELIIFSLDKRLALEGEVLFF